ncbi:MAG: alpha/beta hydrolase [Gammaproteobacteria bacterium]
MKKALKIIAAIIVIVPLAAFGFLVYSTEARRADPMDEALAALVSDDTIAVEIDDWIVMRPVTAEPTAGLILYPGANCDVRGYAKVLKEIAAAGYLVVAVAMPFDFSIFAPNSANAVRDAFPEISDWVIAGHSMGGAMAAQYAFDHQDDLAGLILWDSYPPGPSNLSDAQLPVVHIHRATPEGRSSQVFADKRHLIPTDSTWVPIPGANHMNFGSFIGGGYDEEWDPKIERAEQHRQVVAATLDGLARMTAN